MRVTAADVRGRDGGCGCWVAASEPDAPENFVVPPSPQRTTERPRGKLMDLGTPRCRNARIHECVAWAGLGRRGFEKY